MISERWPETDATVVRSGLRRLLAALPVLVLVTAMSGAGLYLVVGTGSLVGLLPMSTLVFGIPLLRTAWRDRGWVAAFDSTGFWWMRGKDVALVRWDSLAGVGIYWARSGKGGVVHTIELCPKGEIDRDDPLLWEFVRDNTQPLRPGLPRLRHRVIIRDSRKVYEEALRRWVPGELWFGLVEQPWSYLGAPDRAGHRQRTRDAAARITPEP